jgi:hypothetical protein
VTVESMVSYNCSEIKDKTPPVKTMACCLEDHMLICVDNSLITKSRNWRKKNIQRTK